MDLIRPWNEARPNLKGKALSPAEKTWIGREAARTGTTLESAAQFYRISRHRVNTWKNLVKKGHRIIEKTGRPKCVDTDRFASIEIKFTKLVKIHKSK